MNLKQFTSLTGILKIVDFLIANRYGIYVIYSYN